ncbi:MAG: BspA family leucine-rich repeat surface protein, partial [Oscillospiraceae bacterium]|nr:BspA family leucine-rich repeat surface protein [Oscillospiraceae bacterium]
MGGSGTTYVFEYDDAHYARIDGGESAPGVFTRAWYRWTSSTGTLAIFGQLPDTTVRKSELGAITGANDLATQAGVDREAVRRIIVESGTKTSKNAGGMFYGMTFVYDIARLYQLDTSAAESMDGMFCGCQELQTADVSKFDTSNITDMARMFSGCTSLRGGAGTKFNSSYTNYLYARIDKGTTQPDYLSAKKNDDWYEWDGAGTLTLKGQLPDT